MLAGLRDLPELLHKRRQVQATRTVPVDYLESLLSPPQD
jgi:hypothetical protein